MMTDALAAQLCLAIYGSSMASHPGFASFDEGLDDGICWAIARDVDWDAIVLRGSISAHDWLMDAMARPYGSRRFGPVHHGFYLGLDNMWDDCAPLLRPHLPIYVMGHSLGAARATILTAIMLEAGLPPVARIVFGEPKPGFGELAGFIKGVPARSYRNGMSDAHDIVTDLPLTIPAIGMNYEHPTPLTFVNAPPPPDDMSGMFAWHHMPLYAAALSALQTKED